MVNIINYLYRLRNDIFKLLPMKEEEKDGEKQDVSEYLQKYLESLRANIKGAMITFPELGCSKLFVHVTNDLNYIATEDTNYTTWRKIILRATREIDDLRNYYKKARGDGGS